MTEDQTHITQWIGAWMNHGPIPEEVANRVYGQLRILARKALRNTQAGTLNTSDLVHEAYLRIGQQDQEAFQNRAHFFGAAARVMRFIIVDYIRNRSAQKRGGSARELTLDQAVAPEWHELGLIDLDRALTQLAQRDERKAKIAEMRIFSELTVKEISDILDVSEKTVKRDWAFVRTYLARKLGHT